ncbi:glycoside hydrolase [Sabulilitoribacter arenilitoris]|uniref:Glycoside hydrolase n=1 Tax=Wocania arenilitoris TaxID=2044858 RepID=A0AAE3EK97_9FLAO|nr:trehalase family glycosidase [Wocania arenilitoris]MCF7567061.1 glycoside hydrolase [Wocania arenilitoris]
MVLLILTSSCDRKLEVIANTSNDNRFLSDALNFKGVPESPQDRSISSFCDLGSWHSFALPDDSKEFYGSFIGPFSMNRDNGIWLGKTFAKFILYKKNKEEIQYVSVNLSQYPGFLEQHIVTEIKGLEVNLKLWFNSNKSIFVSATVSNKSSVPIELFMGWKGDVWLETAQFNLNEQLEVNFSDSESTHQYHFDKDFNTEVSSTGKFYNSITKKPYKILSNSSENINLLYVSLFNKLQNKESQSINDDAVAGSYSQTIKRWKSYHDAFPYKQNHWLDSLNFELLKTKSIQTLIGNWKSASGELRHDGLFPSYLYKGFNGFWAWDSWKHAAALARFEPKLAKDQMLTMFSYQDNEGMIPDCIYRDTLIQKHNWRDTKPPLATWAVNQIFEKTSDTAFVAKMFPKLIKYHYWWYKNRDHNRNKLCEYGSTDGTRIAAAWESGMDNAVRFDNALLVKNNSNAWSLNQESVDLNAYLLDEKKQLIKLAKISNNMSSVEVLKNDYNEISMLFNNAFYNTDVGYYFDRQLENNQLVNIIGPEGWLPLWSGIATSETAESVKNKIFDESLFYSKIPLPTLNISHKDFDPENGYWRGPVWLDQAYFAIIGLENYGFHEEAKTLKLKLVKNAEGLLDKGYAIRENYHPISGKGLNAKHFSWSAAHLLLLIE